MDSTPLEHFDFQDMFNVLISTRETLYVQERHAKDIKTSLYQFSFTTLLLVLFNTRSVVII